MAHFIRNTSLVNGGGGETDTPEENGTQPKLVGSHGNTRLPFGLCQRYGISLPQNATPRDAWNALKGEIGITPEKAYNDLEENEEHLKKNNELIPKAPQESGQIDYQAEKSKMLADESRVVYSKRWSQERLSQVLDCGTEEMSGLTSKLFNDDSFGFRDNERCTAFYPNFNKVCIPEKDDGGGENSPFSKGGAFYHEMWHAIDHNYGKGYTLSCDCVLSNGRTFRQTLNAEIRGINWDEVKSEIAKERNEYIGTFSEEEKANMKKFYEEASDELTKIYWYQGTRAGHAYEKSEKCKTAIRYKGIVNGNINTEKMQQRWGDLSDIYSCMTDDRQRLVGMGHAGRYWSSDYRNQGLEAFAECASAKATNPESWEILQRYCPKTTAAFNEIIEKLKKGEIKSNGRQKFER